MSLMLYRGLLVWLSERDPLVCANNAVNAEAMTIKMVMNARCCSLSTSFALPNRAEEVEVRMRMAKGRSIIENRTKTW